MKYQWPQIDLKDHIDAPHAQGDKPNGEIDDVSEKDEQAPSNKFAINPKYSSSHLV